MWNYCPENSSRSASEIVSAVFQEKTVLFFPFSFLLAQDSLWLWWRNEWVPGSLQRLVEDSETHPQGLLLIPWWPDQSGEFLQGWHSLLWPAAAQKGNTSTVTLASSGKTLPTLLWLGGWGNEQCQLMWLSGGKYMCRVVVRRKIGWNK